MSIGLKMTTLKPCVTLVTYLILCTHMIRAWNREEIVELWNEGVSAVAIVARLKLDVSVRQVLRIGARYGDRKQRQSGRLDTLLRLWFLTYAVCDEHLGAESWGACKGDND